MRVRSAVIALLAAVALLATACSSAPAPAAPGSTTPTASAGATSTSQMDSSNPDAGALLTVADVESAAAMTGLRLMPANETTEAVGRLNFANADGKLVAIMNVGDAVAFDQSLGGMNYSKDATGTGDMCYVGPDPRVSPVLTIFAAAKGDHAVMMKTFLKVKGGTETWLTIDQLQTLVGLALSRWP